MKAVICDECKTQVPPTTYGLAPDGWVSVDVRGAYKPALDYCSFHRRIQPAEGNAKGGSLADVYGSPANARLIAAAPDLLQALYEVVAECYYLPNPGDRPCCTFCQQDEGEPHEPECSMHFVNEAVAKAEGRS